MAGMIVISEDLGPGHTQLRGLPYGKQPSLYVEWGSVPSRPMNPGHHLPKH
jgi:hypothetical protein